MGPNQSSLNLRQLKRRSQFNQSVCSFLQIPNDNNRDNDYSSKYIQPSDTRLAMDNINIVELSYDLMAKIAMTKVNSLNVNAYYPLLSLNPFASTSGQDKKTYLLNLDFTENIDKMFELQKNNLLVSSIEEEDSEEDSSIEQKLKEMNDNEARQKSYEKTYASDAMKKLLNQNQGKTAILHTSNDETLKYTKQQQTSQEYEINSNQSYNNAQSIGIKEETHHDNVFLINQIESNNFNTKEKNTLNYKQKRNHQSNGCFRIDIQQLLKEERLKQHLEQKKIAYSNKISQMDTKNTTFIEQIDKYMELDTSYSIKLSKIKSEKKLPNIAFKNNKPSKTSQKSQNNKAKKSREKNQISPPLITLTNETYQQDIIDKLNYDMDKMIEENEPDMSLLKNKEENDDEFVSACSSPRKSVSNCNKSNNSYIMKKSPILQNSYYTEAEGDQGQIINFEQYD